MTTQDIQKSGIVETWEERFYRTTKEERLKRMSPEEEARYMRELDEKDRLLAERKHKRMALERDYKERGDTALRDAGFRIIRDSSTFPEGVDCQVYLFGHTDNKGLQTLSKIRLSGKFENVQTAILWRELDYGSLSRKGDIALFIRSGGWVQHVGRVIEDGGIIHSKMSHLGSVTEGSADLFPNNYGDYVEYWRRIGVGKLTPDCDPYNPYVLTNYDLSNFWDRIRENR